MSSPFSGMLRKAKLRLKRTGRRGQPGEPTTASTTASHTATTSPPATAPAEAPQIAPTSASGVATSASIVERIWKKAYDKLHDSNPELIESYESIVASKLGSNPRNGDGPEQTKQLVLSELERIKKIYDIKKNISQGLKRFNEVRGIIEKALRALPESSVIWMAVGLMLDVVSNPVHEAEANRKGLEYILSRIEWYFALAEPLLHPERLGDIEKKMKAGLEERLVDLFKKVLIFELSSVCYFSRSEFTRLTRDLFKWDDWEAQLSEIKAIEQLFSGDLGGFSHVMTPEHLSNIVQAAREATDTLQSIENAVGKKSDHDDHRSALEKDSRCMQDLHVVDPYANKMRLESAKGGLIKDCYAWIHGHSFLQRLLDGALESQERALWVQGDPGKGKTMLMCGLIDELRRQSRQRLIFFFCQASEDSQNTPAMVLRGLIHMLCEMQHDLLVHVRKKYDTMGPSLFRDQCAAESLSQILLDMLSSLSSPTVILIDGLDECQHDLPSLLKPMLQQRSTKAKWVLSSRVTPQISTSLADLPAITRLKLDTKYTANAVRVFIDLKLGSLKSSETGKHLEPEVKERIARYLSAHGQGTFLWVALVCQSIVQIDPSDLDTVDLSKLFPSGLKQLYERLAYDLYEASKLSGMLYLDILAMSTVAQRPLSLKELASLLPRLQGREEEIVEIIERRSSFLATRGDLVYFIHESARQYLLTNFEVPTGRSLEHQHQLLFSAALDSLDEESFKKDLCDTKDAGIKLNRNEALTGPLQSLDYLCVAWPDHLVASGAHHISEAVANSGRVLKFFKIKMLIWLEALSLLDSLHLAVRHIERLLALDNIGPHLSAFLADARRFVLFNKGAIELAPLQVYSSALIFSPEKSLVKRHFLDNFEDYRLSWVEEELPMSQNWSNCLQVTRAPSSRPRDISLCGDAGLYAYRTDQGTIQVRELASQCCIHELTINDRDLKTCQLSTDGSQIALLFADMHAGSSAHGSVEVWDVEHRQRVFQVGLSKLPSKTSFKWLSGGCFAMTSEGGDLSVWRLSTAQRLWGVEAPNDGSNRWGYLTENWFAQIWEQRIRTWDIESREGPRELQGSSWHRVLGHRGPFLAARSINDETFIFDVPSQKLLSTLKIDRIVDVAFMTNERKCASDANGFIQIWDIDTGACLQAFRSKGLATILWAFTKNDTQLVGMTWNHTFHIWDLEIPYDDEVVTTRANVHAATISENGERLAVAMMDESIKIWDTTSKACLREIELPNERIASLRFSPGGAFLTYATYNGLVGRVALSNSADGGDNRLVLPGIRLDLGIEYSSNEHLIAIHQTNGDTIRIWDTAGERWDRILTWSGQSIVTTALSPDGTRLAALGHGRDKSLRIWNTADDTVAEISGSIRAESSLLSFTGDGKNVVSSDGSSITVFDAVSLQPALPQQIPTEYSGLSRLTYNVKQNTKIHTNLGLIDLGLVPGQVPGEVQGYAVSEDRQWVLKNGKRFLFLPEQYQLSTMACGTTLIHLASDGQRLLALRLSGDY